MANRYYGQCWKCKKEIIAFRPGFNPCNDMDCIGGSGWCSFPAKNGPVYAIPESHLTHAAPDAAPTGAE